MEVILLGIFNGCFKRKIGNGIWKVFLGFFNEKQLRNKESSTGLEANLM